MMEARPSIHWWRLCSLLLLVVCGAASGCTDDTAGLLNEVKTANLTTVLIACGFSSDLKYLPVIKTALDDKITNCASAVQALDELALDFCDRSCISDFTKFCPATCKHCGGTATTTVTPTTTTHVITFPPPQSTQYNPTNRNKAQALLQYLHSNVEKFVADCASTAFWIEERVKNSISEFLDINSCASMLKYFETINVDICSLPCTKYAAIAYCGFCNRVKTIDQVTSVNSWNLVPYGTQSPPQRAFHTAVVMGGKYLVTFGGLTNSIFITSNSLAEIYKTYSEGGKAAAVLPFSSETWAFEITGHLWFSASANDPSPPGRMGHSANLVALPGEVAGMVMFGGWAPKGDCRDPEMASPVFEFLLGECAEIFQSTWILRLRKDENNGWISFLWTEVEVTSRISAVGRFGHISGVYNNEVFIWGGLTTLSKIQSVSRFSVWRFTPEGPSKGYWTELRLSKPVSFPLPLLFATGTVSPGGIMTFLGGLIFSQNVTAECDDFSSFKILGVEMAFCPTEDRRAQQAWQLDLTKLSKNSSTIDVQWIDVENPELVSDFSGGAAASLVYNDYSEGRIFAVDGSSTMFEIWLLALGILPVRSILDNQETWQFQNQWEKTTTQTYSKAPFPRVGASLAASEGSGSVILFGGLSSFSWTLHNDVWNGIPDESGVLSWMEMAASSTPVPAQYSKAAVAGDDIYIYFSTAHNQYSFQERPSFWKLSTKTLIWSQLPIAYAVGTRTNASLVTLYSQSATPQLFLYGGKEAAPNASGFSSGIIWTAMHDLWVYNVVTFEWTKLNEIPVVYQGGEQHDMFAHEYEALIVLIIYRDPVAVLIYDDSLQWKPLTIHNPGPVSTQLYSTYVMPDVSNKLGFIYSLKPSGGFLELWKLDLDSGMWEKIDAQNPPSNRYSPTMLTLSENKLLLNGGFLDWRYDVHDQIPINFTDEIWEYALSENTWVQMQPNQSNVLFDPVNVNMGTSVLYDLDVYTFGGLRSAFEKNVKTSDMYRLQYNCLPGYYSPYIRNTSCKLCPQGKFSTTSRTNCVSCPGETYTAHSGAESSKQCLLCAPNACNGHGTCTVTSTHSGEIVCSCNTMWKGTSRCASPIGWIITAITIVLILVMIAAGVKWLRGRMKKRISWYEEYQTRLLTELDEKEEVLNSTREDLLQLETAFNISPTEVQLRRKLDEGKSGEVWLADWTLWEGQSVAVKRLRESTLALDDLSSSEFEGEIRFLRTLRHPNIVLFLGAGKFEDVPFLVTEYLSRGSLFHLIEDKQLRIDHLILRMISHVANGMQFLHGLEPPVIHRDLKSKNLFVSENFTVKIGDLGSKARWRTNFTHSREEYDVVAYSCLERDREMTRYVGTLLWTAPEILNGNSTYDPSVDVYSFGIILWELITRTLPFAHYKRSWEIETAVIEGERPPIPVLPKCIPDSYVTMMSMAWCFDPKARPTFAQIFKDIQTMKEESLEIQNQSLAKVIESEM